MTVLTVPLKDYTLTLDQMQLLAEECYGKPLTNGEGDTLDLGFEDPAHAKAFQHCLLCFLTFVARARLAQEERDRKGLPPS